MVRRLTLMVLVLLQALLCASAASAYYSGTLTPGNPLAGHPWFVDNERGTWQVAARTQLPSASPLLAEAENPMGKTFAAFVKDPETTIRDYLVRSQIEEPGSIPFLNLARIESPSCPYRGSHPGFSEQQVDTWAKGFAAGLGHYGVEVTVETDKLTNIRCLPPWAQARRFRELRYEVHTLHRDDPNAIIYLDAGAGDWGKPPPTIARWLRKADVAEAQGFELNASHHDWTGKEVRFGVAVSGLIHGKHFVVNTNSNAWGPDPHGPSPYYHRGCTPPGEGLGYQPTVNTGNPLVDAYVWAGTPGFESGDCLGLGSHAAYTFYLSEAISLAVHANPR